MHNRLKREWWQLYGIVAGGVLVSCVVVRLHPSKQAQMLALAVIVSATYGLAWLWTEAHADLLERNGVDAGVRHDAARGARGLPTYSITFVMHTFDEGPIEVCSLLSPPKRLEPPIDQATSLRR